MEPKGKTLDSRKLAEENLRRKFSIFVENAEFSPGPKG